MEGVRGLVSAKWPILKKRVSSISYTQIYLLMYVFIITIGTDSQNNPPIAGPVVGVILAVIIAVIVIIVISLVILRYVL